MFQPQTASVQPVQSAVQQVTSQPTQTTTPQVTATQLAAAQATPATTTVSQSNISVAALQTAGLSINPAIVSKAPQSFMSAHGFCTAYDVGHCDFMPRSMLLPWELSPSSLVPSPPLRSSPMPCPTWLVSPVRSSQTPRDRWVL